ncbi:hypothetical protein BRC95_08670 [Halobacteriales archaeon QS_5_68_33]|nr:MAG: hypothetical protein BRC95_08670 [Halobacteriales archaeon QS_5_68_33]
MTERDALDAFDAGLVTEVAGDRDIDPDRLATLARTHQSNVRDLPGVDDIVYEWRTQFHQDPLLARTTAAYYLALPGHVWDEFADDIGASDAERAALVALHGRQTRIDADGVGADTARLETSEPVVLTRP